MSTRRHDRRSGRNGADAAATHAKRAARLAAPVLVACATLAVARQAPMPAEATPVVEPAPTAEVAQRGGGISLEQAVSIATSRFPGRVVRAETTSRGGRPIHVIRILGEDGRVRMVRVDAQTGQLL